MGSYQDGGSILLRAVHTPGLVRTSLFGHILPRICILRFAIFANLGGKYGEIVPPAVVSGRFFDRYPNISLGS